MTSETSSAISGSVLPAEYEAFPVKDIFFSFGNVSGLRTKTNKENGTK
jgi:hypothetical protein